MPRIITGHTGTPHISADDVGALLQRIIGNNDYLLTDNPNAVTAVLLGNNIVQLPDAEVVLQGTHIRIQSTDTVTVPQGQNGMKRIDLIVCRYSKDDNGVESAFVDIVQGTPAASDPVAPVVAQGDIRNGATLHEMPLFKVELEGVTIERIVSVFNTITSLKTAFTALSGNLSDIDAASQSRDKALSENIATVDDAVNKRIDIIKTNRILWSGAYYMTASHSIKLPAFTTMPNGVVLAFSRYSDGKASDYDWHCFYVPKIMPAKNNGGGSRFTMVSGLFSSFCSKYLYFKNLNDTVTSISGHDSNNKSGTSASGVKYNNAAFVLRYVIGV